MKLNRTLWVPVLLVVSLVLGVVASIYMQDKEPEDLKAKYLPAGDFTLSLNDKPFASASLRGQPFILYFGFTSCPDVCPLGLSTIRDALKSDSQLANTPALFVSLDPERDTSEVLSAYVGFFHENIVPLRGSLEQTQAVAKQYGTYFMKAPLSDDPSQYTVDHTAYFFVINGDGQLARVLDHDAKAEQIASALIKLI